MYKTRADLMTHPAFAGLETDTSGNPCVWENHYQNDSGSWCSSWSCRCDDDGVEPYDSLWLPTGDVYTLWENLPEAGDAPTHRSAVFLNARELATVLAALRLFEVQMPRLTESLIDVQTDGDTLKPLDLEEINTLCERLNQ